MKHLAACLISLILLTSALVTGVVVGSPVRGAPEPDKAAVIFQEVPAATSGITWTHNNAHSPEHYLPETVGPGCAFLDYDNDGWMDIYLVNSGPCDFYN